LFFVRRLLDHGLYANLTDKFRYDYSNLWLSILNVDRKGMRQHSEQLGIKVYMRAKISI